jgi:glucans biosynthesis protein C
MNNSQVLTTYHNYSFDFIRAITMLSVILYHAAGAYSSLSPYWLIHDMQYFLGNALRELLDVFIMPFFLFIAGYFALPSIRNKSLSDFIINKFYRIGVYWLFIVLIFLPFMLWKAHQSSGSYLDYWLSSLLSFKNISAGPLTLSMYSHMHLWFVSLLFYILVLFGIFYKFFIKKNIAISKSYKEINISNLLVFGILTTFVYFISILFFPDSSWIIIPMILQFKTTQLLILILYFGFGVYSRYMEWFANNDIPLNLNLWISSVILFTILFFITGQDIFNNIDISNTLSPLYLFIFSLIRSFLLLSYLILFLSLGIKYFNTKTVIIKKISDVSYEIYLVHIFFIYTFQFIFLQFGMIPVTVKIFGVFIFGTFFSYFFGKYTLYKFPKMSAAVMFILFFVLMVIFNR